MAWSSTEESRVLAIETKLNQIQEALNNLATRRMVKGITATLQPQIDTLTSSIDNIEEAGTGTAALVTHKTDPSAHTELNDRYVQLGGGFLDDRYYTKVSYISSSAGTDDAGKPIVLNASGLLDLSFIPDLIEINTLTGLLDTAIASPTTGQVLQYNGSYWENTNQIDAALTINGGLTVTNGNILLDASALIGRSATGSRIQFTDTNLILYAANTLYFSMLSNQIYVWQPMSIREGATVSSDENLAFGGIGVGHWHKFNSSTAEYEFWTTNSNGVGADNLIYIVPSGTDDMRFYGNLEASGLTIKADPADDIALHVSGGTRQLVLEAQPGQTAAVPTIELRTSSGTKVLGIHGDPRPSAYNILIGDNQGAGLDPSSPPAGTGMVCIGEGAGRYISTGKENILVGRAAGQNLTTGYRNTAIGYSAGTGLSPGSYYFCTYMGYTAGLRATTGGSNVGIGYESLRWNQTGAGNTAVGAYSGDGSSGNSHSGNTLIGFKAGYLLATGGYNIFLGYQAGSNTTTGEYNILIGTNLNTPEVDASYTLNIGDTIKGDLSTQALEFQGDVSVSGDLNLNLGQIIYFDIDSNQQTKIYSPSNGYINLDTAGANRVQISSAQVTFATSLYLLGGAQVRFGTGQPYWANYNSTADQFEFWTNDSDGVGTNQLVYSVSDGTDDVRFYGGISVSGQMHTASGIVISKNSGNGIKVDIDSPTYPWKDLVSEIVVKTAGAGAPIFGTYQGNLQAYYLSNATTQQVYQTFHMPHDYAPGTDIYIHVHWSQNVVDTGAAGSPGDVKFSFDVSYAKGHNQAAFSTPIVTSVIQTASSTQYQHMLAEVQLSAKSPSASQLDTDDLEPDGLIMVRIWRDPTDGSDTLDQVPFVHYVDLHYQSTEVGTKQKVPNFYV